jgi:putative tricarboxylic transport membrane protein
MLTTDRVGGSALVLFALGVLWESRKLPLGSLHNPGPAYMPVVLAVALVVFGAILVLRGGDSEPVSTVGWGEWRHAVAILAVCAFAALALDRLGYRITVAVALAFLLGVVEHRRFFFTTAVALGMAFGTFYLFDTLLRTPLPRGPFGL